MHISTHYSCAMEAESLYSFASSAAECLIAEAEKNAVDISAFTLCYSGMSGIALATAIQYELYLQTGIGIGMIYARKEGEKSHGLGLEFTGKADKGFLVFVDDLISSGETMERVINTVMKYFNGSYRYSYICLGSNESNGPETVTFANVQNLSLDDIVIQHTCL